MDTIESVSSNKSLLNSSTERSVQVRDTPQQDILAYRRWPESRYKEGDSWELDLDEMVEFVEYFYRDILTTLTNLQIFEPVSDVLSKLREIAAMEKLRERYRTHTLRLVLTRQKITAANGESAIIQLGNLTLIFASPRGGGSISAR